MDFDCPSCGEHSEIKEVSDIEQDGDTLYMYYLHRCPKCGRKFRLTEAYHWDSITNIERA